MTFRKKFGALQNVTKDVTKNLPVVTKDFNLVDDAQARGVVGISSGGICAFTAAWERPDYFSKVISYIGSFTNIRGGHVYPALIRKTEPKPIRVFLQEGENDLDNLHGHWPLANRQMAAALNFAKCYVFFNIPNLPAWMRIQYMEMHMFLTKTA